MGATTISSNTDNVTQSLVRSLLEVFDATKDLYLTLSIKEKRDYERSLHSRGYPTSRTIEFIDEDVVGTEDDISMDKAAVREQYKTGAEELGASFMQGDILAQAALQAEIITLQGLLVTTFLYGPTSPKPVSHQLAELNIASRAASTATVNILAAQLQRQRLESPSTSHYSKHHTDSTAAPSRALTVARSAREGSLTSESLVAYRQPTKVRSGSPVNTTIQDWRDSVEPEKSITERTSTTHRAPTDATSISRSFFCRYALDLQQDPLMDLPASITSDPRPHCPDCARPLNLSSSKKWEILKRDDGYERCFQVSNRFVVKCHRDCPDGQYCCAICSVNGSMAVCGDVKALIKHMFEDHTANELKHDVDIMEVVELPKDRRRDSIHSHHVPRSSRRSASVGSGHRRSKASADYDSSVHRRRSLRPSP